MKHITDCINEALNKSQLPKDPKEAAFVQALRKVIDYEPTKLYELKGDTLTIFVSPNQYEVDANDAKANLEVLQAIEALGVKKLIIDNTQANLSVTQNYDFSKFPAIHIHASRGMFTMFVGNNATVSNLTLNFKRGEVSLFLDYLSDATLKNVSFKGLSSRQSSVSIDLNGVSKVPNLSEIKFDTDHISFEMDDNTRLYTSIASKLIETQEYKNGSLDKIRHSNGNLGLDGYEDLVNDPYKILGDIKVNPSAHIQVLNLGYHNNFYEVIHVGDATFTPGHSTAFWYNMQYKNIPVTFEAVDSRFDC